MSCRPKWNNNIYMVKEEIMIIKLFKCEKERGSLALPIYLLHIRASLCNAFLVFFMIFFNFYSIVIEFMRLRKIEKERKKKFEHV
jgi:hypothetical protein